MKFLIKKYLDLLSFRNEVADALLKAKLDPPSVAAINPVGRPRLTTASPEELANHQGGNGLSAKRLRPNSDVRFLFCFVLFAIFILHLRKSELYRYTLDGKSALAWELPFSRFMGHLSST